MAATRLFVSHSSQDNDWCRPFVAALTSADPSLDVWYDEHGLSGGSAWVQTLQQELQARDVVVLVLTPDSLASQWVQQEMQLALATRVREPEVGAQRLGRGELDVRLRVGERGGRLQA